MPEGEIPQGQRFSLVYLRSDGQLEDSVRMRRRLGSTVYEHKYGRDGFAAFLRRKLGLEYKFLNSQSDWSEYYVGLDLRDVLDSVTVFLDHMAELVASGEYAAVRHAQVHRSGFLREVRQIFAEEGVRYKADDRGGVHLSVDEQFEATRAATIQGLGSPRYAGAIVILEAGYKALDAVPSDGRKAIRDVFGATENIFKMMFGVQQLKGDLIARELKPKLDLISATPEARNANRLMCDGLSKWVDAAHFYRHEIGRPEPHQPPMDLAIIMVSQGTSFVRWLVMIEREINLRNAPPEV